MYTVIMVYQRLFTPPNCTLILDIHLYVLAQARPNDLHSLVCVVLCNLCIGKSYNIWLCKYPGATGEAKCTAKRTTGS